MTPQPYAKQVEQTLCLINNKYSVLRREFLLTSPSYCISNTDCELPRSPMSFSAWSNNPTRETVCYKSTREKTAVIHNTVTFIILQTSADYRICNLLFKINFYSHLTTASLKWRLGAWDTQELPLLAASSKMTTAPLAGKSWQPSHEPPHSKRNRHPSHCWNSGKGEGKGVGGELPGRWAAKLRNARERLLYVCHATLSYNPQARGIPTHAHMCRDRWPPGM